MYGRSRGRMFGGRVGGRRLKAKVRFDDDDAELIDDPDDSPVVRRVESQSARYRLGKKAPPRYFKGVTYTPPFSKKSGRKGKRRPPKSRRVQQMGFTTESSLKETLNMVHPGIGMKGTSKTVIANMMNDVMHNLATVASSFMKSANRQTLQPNDIAAAVAQVYPNTLGTQANILGQAALRKYASKTGIRPNMGDKEYKGGNSAAVRRLGSGLSHIGSDDIDDEFLPY